MAAVLDRTSTRRSLLSTARAPPSSLRSGSSHASSTGWGSTARDVHADVPGAPAQDALGLPGWVGGAKSAVLDSKEWKDLKALVYSKLTAHLNANHLVAFGELDDEEKLLFISRIEVELAAEPLYAQVAYRTAAVLDAALAEAAEASVRAAVVARRPTRRGTAAKRAALLDSASAAVVSLMDKWPDQDRNLGVLVNQALVNPLRGHVWHRALINEPVEHEYDIRVSAIGAATDAATAGGSSGFVGAGSGDLVDEEAITLSVRELFVSQFPNLRVSVRQLTAMKTMLAFHAAGSKSPANIPDYLYYLALPLVLVFFDDAVAPPELARCVGYFARLVRLPRPRLLAASSRKSERQASNEFAAQFSALLNATDPELHTVVLRLLQDVADITAESNTAALASLLGPTVERIFVGVTSIDTTLYIWDSCLLLGFDAIYYFAVCLFILLRKGILLCKSLTSLQRLIVDQAPTLAHAQFQQIMAQKFLPTLRAKHNLPELADLRALSFATPAFASRIPSAHLDSSAAFWDSPLVPEDVVSLLANTMGPAITAGRSIAGLDPESAKAAMEARLAASTGSTGALAGYLGIGSSSPGARRVDAHGRILPPGMPRPRLPAARTAALMRRWRLMAWHAGIWASFLLSHKRHAASRPKAKDPPPLAAVSSSPHPTIRAGAPLQLRPILVTHHRDLIRLYIPPIYPAIDRLSDTLDRIESFKPNHGMFPTNVDERDDFAVAVEDVLFRFLPFLEDDTREDILKIELPSATSSGTHAIFLRPVPGSSGRPQITAVLRRNGVAPSILPKILGVYNQVTGRTLDDDPDDYRDGAAAGPAGIDNLTDSIIQGIPLRPASALSRSRAQGSASLDASPRFPRSPQGPASRRVSLAPPASGFDDYEYEYEDVIDPDDPDAEPATDDPDATDAPLDPAQAPGLTNLQKFFVGVVGSAMDSVKLLALGGDRDKERLMESVNSIRQVRAKDLYDAEMAAFGKTLTQAEIRKLPNKQLVTYNKKVLSKTRAKEQARYKAELAARQERRRRIAETQDMIADTATRTIGPVPQPDSQPQPQLDDSQPQPQPQPQLDDSQPQPQLDDSQPQPDTADPPPAHTHAHAHTHPDDGEEFEYEYEYEYDDVYPQE